MSGKAVITLVLGAALLAGTVRAGEAAPPVTSEPGPAEMPAELRDTLPGGSRLDDAPELPRASVDVLPRPTPVRIQVKRQAPPAKD